MAFHLDVISAELSGGVLVQKSHVEDFNTKSQLIVNESQEALFYKDGQALDLFGPGRHTLNSDNVPLLRRLIAPIFGGKTPFPCEVYFINKITVLDLLWGTDSPILIEDPRYKVFVKLRANGQTGLHVSDSRRFVVKVVGQLREFTDVAVRRAIKGMLLSAIRETITSAIVDNGYSVIEINTILSTLSDRMTEKLNGRLADIGLAIDHFSIVDISPDAEDLQKVNEAKNLEFTRLSEARVEAQKMDYISEARARARSREGYTYQDERRFDVLEGAAKNEGAAGGLVNLGVGMGAGVGLTKEFGRMADFGGNQQQGYQQPQQTAAGHCSKCGSPLAPGAKFCSGCGSPVEAKPAFCPNCGTRCPDGARFCTNCGTNLSGANEVNLQK